MRGGGGRGRGTRDGDGDDDDEDTDKELCNTHRPACPGTPAVLRSQTGSQLAWIAAGHTAGPSARRPGTPAGRPAPATAATGGEEDRRSAPWERQSSDKAATKQRQSSDKAEGPAAAVAAHAPSGSGSTAASPPRRPPGPWHGPAAAARSRACRGSRRCATIATSKKEIHGIQAVCRPRSNQHGDSEEIRRDSKRFTAAQRPALRASCQAEASAAGAPQHLPLREFTSNDLDVCNNAFDSVLESNRIGSKLSRVESSAGRSREGKKRSGRHPPAVDVELPAHVRFVPAQNNPRSPVSSLRSKRRQSIPRTCREIYGVAKSRCSPPTSQTQSSSCDGPPPR